MNKFGNLAPGTVSRLRRGVFIDLEATGLNEGSFPIEIGFAYIHTDEVGRDSVRSWSYLIKPHESWDIEAVWSQESGKIHKIPLSDLAFGEPVERVVEDFTRMQRMRECFFSDAPFYDCRWLAPAMKAGHRSEESCENIRMQLELGFKHLFYEGLYDVPSEIVGNVISYLDQTAPNNTPHRAGPDAELMALQALGLVRHLEAGTITQFKSAYE